MNILETLKVYAGKWSVKSERNFTPEEIAAVQRAEVVASDYGASVCFHLVSGGMSFIPLSTNATVGLGESVDMSKAKLVILEKQGENDIMRVDI